MARDEEDIIFHTLMHMGEEGLQGILVADNLSTDNTREEMKYAQKKLKGQCEVVIVEDNDPGYTQSPKMTALARRAAEEYGATWIVPFDSDELWIARRDRLGIVLQTSPGVDIVTVPLFNHFPSAIDLPSDNPFKAIIWRQQAPGALPKVAFRWREDAVVQQGNHGVVFTEAEPGSIVDRPLDLEIRHFPYRRYAQFRRKVEVGAAAYAATDLPEHFGAHWRSYQQILERHGDEALREVYDRWFYFLSPVDGGLVRDPAPFRRWS